MPVEAQTVEYSHLGDGVTVSFPFPSKFLGESDILVGINGAEQAGGFAVEGAGDEAGGSVVFSAPPASGARVLLLRKPPASQLIDFVNGQTVLEGVLDTGLDKLTMIVQYLLRTFTRTVRLSDFDVTEITPLTASADERANRAITFSADGEQLVPGPTASEIAAAEVHAETALAALASMGNAELIDTAYSNLVVGGDWSAAIAALIAGAAASVKPARLTGARTVDGVVETATGLTLDGGTLVQTGPSVVGAFLTNVTLAAGGRQQSDITIRNTTVDGDSYPQPVYFVLPSNGTTTTVTLPVGASAVDGFYTGLILQRLTGVGMNASQYRSIIGYVGATRTATLSSALTSAPQAGDSVAIGYNDNAIGFAWGARRVRLEGVTAHGYDMRSQVPFGAGGKGVNFEQGVDGAVLTGSTFYDLFTAVFISGRAGTMTNGANASVVGVRVSDYRAENCGSALTVANMDQAAGISTAGGELDAVVENFTWHNCGHAPDRPVTTSLMKSGIINLLGPNGVTIRGGRGWNDTTYPNTTPGYPTDYPTRCGYGLSGPVGALLWGHARNTTVSDIVHIGDLDAVVRIGRARAVGDDGAPSGYVSACFAWDIDGATVVGTVDYVVDTEAVYWLSGSNEISGSWRLAVNAATLGLCHPNMANVTQLMLDITELQTGKRIIGTPKDIIAAGNSFASFSSGVTHLSDRNRHIVGNLVSNVADDTAQIVTPPATFGTVVVASDTSLLRAFFGFRVGASPQCTLLGPNIANVAATTGELTGTDGADGHFTVAAHTDGKLYMENRRGGAISYTLTFIG